LIDAIINWRHDVRSTVLIISCDTGEKHLTSPLSLLLKLTSLLSSILPSRQYPELSHHRIYFSGSGLIMRQMSTCLRCWLPEKAEINEISAQFPTAFLSICSNPYTVDLVYMSRKQHVNAYII